MNDAKNILKAAIRKLLAKADRKLYEANRLRQEAHKLEEQINNNYEG